MAVLAEAPAFLSLCPVLPGVTLGRGRPSVIAALTPSPPQTPQSSNHPTRRRSSRQFRRSTREQTTRSREQLDVTPSPDMSSEDEAPEREAFDVAPLPYLPLSSGRGSPTPVLPPLERPSRSLRYMSGPSHMRVGPSPPAGRRNAICAESPGTGILFELSAAY